MYVNLEFVLGLLVKNTVIFLYFLFLNIATLYNKITATFVCLYLKESCFVRDS